MVATRTGTTPVPALAIAPVQTGARSLTLSTWAPGFVPESTKQLSAPDWTTYPTQPPVTIQFGEQAEFFRLKSSGN